MTQEEMDAVFGGGDSPFSDFFNTFFGGQPRAPGEGWRPQPAAAGAGDRVLTWRSICRQRSAGGSRR